MHTPLLDTRRRRRTSRAAIAALAVAGLTATALVVPVGAASAEPVLLSQGKHATASSVENPDYTPASAVVDGDPGTRWSSEFSDPQWIQVDLAESASIERVELDWEGAYASAYEIQVSDDASQWRTVYATNSSSGGNETLDVDGQGRYVRLLATERATGYGVSLWELRVFGAFSGGEPGGPGGPGEPGEPGEPGGPGGPVDPGHPYEHRPLTDPSVVEVAGTHGDWELLVDGDPFTVRGFTWGPSFSAADHYMPGLVDINANTIRTWGTGPDTEELLDSAAAHGIRTIMGFWLVPGGGPGSGGCLSYVSDASYKADAKADILAQVQYYKDHPAVLMWSVGNESILGLGDCFSGAELEAERHAYAAFVNEVAVEIQAIDPNHPVSSTDAWTGAWEYYRASSPDLDLYNLNSYGAICDTEQTWVDGGYDKPYVITEGGAAGEWEVPDDVNGVPDEPTDVEKAQALVDSWRCILDHEGVGLGATFFHYGIEGDFGGVWFNVIPGDNKRLGYYAIGEAWGAGPFANTPPVFASMNVPGSTAVVAGQPFTVELDVTDPDGDPLTLVPFFNSNYVDGSWGLEWTEHTQTGPGTIELVAPQRLGVWKVYVWAEDGQGNVGVETRSFRVVPPAVEGTNVALGKPADASSFQIWGDNYTPGQATDGDFGTRWASEWGETAWFQVDLGAPTSFDHLQLVWEAAYASGYEVQTSDDGSSWTTIHTVTGGDGGFDSIEVSATARFVRLNLTERATEWGFSLYELGIYQR